MLRRILLALLTLLLVTTCALWALKARADRHFYDGYDSTLALNAKVGDITTIEKTQKAFGVETKAKYRLQRIEFDARQGDTVPALLTLPMDQDGPAPAIVLLHGSHQEKEFVQKICTPFNDAGYAMVCFDQHMRGERKVRGGVWTTAMAFRERSWKTIHDARRLVDYLETRPDIDKERLCLVGASYGAITGTALFAQEPRLKAAALVVGGGNLALLAHAPEVQRELPGWLVPFAPTILKLLIGPCDPVLHAPQCAGRPVLMQNGTNDQVVIPEAGKALYAALGEPKEIRWYPIRHPDREEKGEEVIKMLLEGLEWFKELDAK